MKKHNFLVAISVFICSFSATAQELLTPEQAVTMAVAANYDIVIARNESEIASIYNNNATAGMLPTINVTTGDVFNLPNINQKFTTGQEVKRNWVPVNSFNAGVNMQWTIFDGMRMFATKERLATLEAVSLLQLKDKIQTTVAQVLSAYYEIVRQKQYIKALQESVKISEERMTLAQKKFEVGYSDKTPLLQAKVDHAQQQISIVQQQTILQNAKTALNQLLSREPQTEFEVIDEIVVDYTPDLQQMLDTVKNINFSVLSAQKNIDIARLQHKEINAKRLPSIQFTSGYNFTQNNSKAGLQLFNRSYGPTFGLNAVIPVFNGGMVKKELEASAVAIANSEVQLEKLKKEVDTRVVTAYRNYEYARKVWLLYEENVLLAQENVTISLDRFRLNQSNSLEIKQAQSSYEQALYDVILARYNAKLAEIELKRMNNALIAE
ncbi:MAG: hypothetical protein RL222_1723 [Bacteroidota bacterium]|jgi:outer membrane protein TolC